MTPNAIASAILDDGNLFSVFAPLMFHTESDDLADFDAPEKVRVSYHIDTQRDNEGMTYYVTPVGAISVTYTIVGGADDAKDVTISVPVDTLTTLREESEYRRAVLKVDLYIADLVGGIVDTEKSTIVVSA